MKPVEAYIPIPGSNPVSALFNVPDPCPDPIPRVFMLAHGAANDMHNPLLAFLANGLSASGHLALRFNFQYRDQGRKSPDSQKKLEATWLAAFEFIKSHPKYRAQKIVAAGKSMGGRVVSQMAAKETLLADGYIFYGYPLHAPGRSEKQKGEHLFRIKAPMLFFSGTRDALCDLGKLKGVLKKTGASTLETVEGADHSFKTPKSLGKEEKEIYQQILDRTIKWAAGLDG